MAHLTPFLLTWSSQKHVLHLRHEYWPILLHDWHLRLSASITCDRFLLLCKMVLYLM